jgi:uncharacterized protein (TIGR02246 family)
VNKEKDKASPKPANSQDSETVPQVGPYNRALGEIYQRLYPEIRRPKPNQEAIAAALHAMQRLTMESDSENVARDVVEPSKVIAMTCHVCGHRNREGNKFCGACGVSLEPTDGTNPESNIASSASSLEQVPDHSGLQTIVENQTLEPSAPEPQPEEIHPASGNSGGNHYYHHHYHHHYFQNGAEAAPAPRANSEESAREADRLRVAAAAKGEHMTRNEAAVRRLTQEWILACNTRHLDELIELYAADALVLRSNLPPMRGAATVREFFFASLEAGLGEVALDPMRVEVAGDIAHEVGRYSALVPGTTGKRREERGKYLWVFARQASGEWKLTAECWCSDLTLTVSESDIPKSPIAIATKAPPRKS